MPFSVDPEKITHGNLSIVVCRKISLGLQCVTLRHVAIVHLCWSTGILKSFESVQCESKKNPPPGVGWEFLIQILHAYYTFLSTLDYKFLFNYLHL